jgi:hypothetical protein
VNRAQVYFGIALAVIAADAQVLTGAPIWLVAAIEVATVVVGLLILLVVVALSAGVGWCWHRLQEQRGRRS